MVELYTGKWVIKPQKSFVSIANAAVDTNQQYYTLLDNYLHGIKDYSKLFGLIERTSRLGNDSLQQRKWVTTTLVMFCLSFTENDLYTKINIEFIVSFLKGYKDKYFKMFFTNSIKVDSAMGWKGYARNVTDRIIYAEDIALH